MNNAELEKLLKTAATPACEAGYWEQFPKKITANIHWQKQRGATFDAEDFSNRKPGLLLWTAGLASACIILGFAVVFWHGQASSETARQVAAAKRYFQEIAPLFPNQVRAIVFSQQGAQLVLAEKADVPDSPPLFVKVCGPLGCQSFVTFSGQQIRVNGEVCDVLADVRGGVMLVGSKFFWASAQPELAANHLRIEAQALDYSL
jgi:hypothetical protein